jgi:hypothetical protein
MRQNLRATATLPPDLLDHLAVAIEETTGPKTTPPFRVSEVGAGHGFDVAIVKVPPPDQPA